MITATEAKRRAKTNKGKLGQYLLDDIDSVINDCVGKDEIYSLEYLYPESTHPEVLEKIIKTLEENKFKVVMGYQPTSDPETGETYNLPVLMIDWRMA
jgi:hypothetical protein